MQINRVTISGNLTRDPELRTTSSGKAVTSLDLAHNSGYGDNQKAHFFKVNVWEKQAEICCERLQKGSQVIIEGRLEHRTWEADDGGKRSTVEITAVPFGVHFVSRLKDAPAQAPAGPSLEADDIPF